MSVSSLLVILPVASLLPEDIQNATLDATQTRTTFSSDLVQHIEIVENLTIRSSKPPTNSTAPSGILYQVTLNQSRCMEATLELSQPGIYVIFAQYRDIRMKLTTETGAILKSTACFAGCDSIVSSATEKEPISSGRWYHPVLASLVISLTSVVGVFILILYRGKMDNLLDLMISFAAGCLMGVIVFHLYSEATAYLEDAGEWVVGVCVLGGIAFSIMLEQVAWSKTRPAVFGVTAEDGNVYIYDLMMDKIAPVVTLKKHETADGIVAKSTSPMLALDFNPRQRNFVAAGDAAGKIYIWKLSWRLANLQSDEMTVLEALETAA
ncbi:hypothetical protein ABG067_001897 [Albugo candida]